MEPPASFLAEVSQNLENLTRTLTTETQKVLEQTTVSTGKTLDWISSNPLLKAADNVIGLDWLMTFLGQVDTDKIQTTVVEMRSQYPDETPEQIAHRLIIQKTWEGGRLGLLTNIIPPIAAFFLGVELIATTKLQTEMVYEIAAAYNLDLDHPARRGEVLAIFGLSLGADVLKTGLTVVEIIPGIGAVVGASTNAAMLYVLGQTACRFYQGKVSETEIVAMQQATDTDWQVAVNQSKVMDRILAHMVQVSYPDEDWAAILPKLKEISPSSMGTIAESLETPHDLGALLQELIPEFAPLTLNRCYDIAISNGSLTLEEQQILSQIAIKFNLDLSAVSKKQHL
ncbi:MAG: hypothetical protein AAF298_14220 [Cyanobacteria bacterium P01_A01_bin.40]